jgi:hypothetical protein
MGTGEGEIWLPLSLVKVGQCLDQRKKPVIIALYEVCAIVQVSYLLYFDVMQHRLGCTDISALLSVPTSTVKQSKLGCLI